MTTRVTTTTRVGFYLLGASVGLYAVRNWDRVAHFRAERAHQRSLEADSRQTWRALNMAVNDGDLGYSGSRPHYPETAVELEGYGFTVERRSTYPEADYRHQEKAITWPRGDAKC